MVWFNIKPDHFYLAHLYLNYRSTVNTTRNYSLYYIIQSSKNQLEISFFDALSAGFILKENTGRQLFKKSTNKTAAITLPYPATRKVIAYSCIST